MTYAVPALCYGTYCNQVTDNRHLSDWIDTALNKFFWDDVIESWFKVAC